MQRLFFVIFIFSNLLFIQGQPRDFPIELKGDTVNKLYDYYIPKQRSAGSACTTEECKLDELIKKFSEVSSTQPPIAAPTRPSILGGIISWLVKKKDLVMSKPKQ